MRKERIFHCAQRRCFCACAKRGYFIAPRGDVSAHAQREDISLRQEEMFLRMRKRAYFIVVRGDVSVHALGSLFHCAKRRCFCSCTKRFFIARGYCISLRQGKMFQHMCKRILNCVKVKMFLRVSKREYFIAPRGDASAHVQREDISLRQEEMLIHMHKERIFIAQ